MGLRNVWILNVTGCKPFIKRMRVSSTEPVLAYVMHQPHHINPLRPSPALYLLVFSLFRSNMANRLGKSVERWNMDQDSGNV